MAEALLHRIELPPLDYLRMLRQVLSLSSALGTNSLKGGWLGPVIVLDDVPLATPLGVEV